MDADGLAGETLVGKELPKTGFAPGIITSIPRQPADHVYIDSPFDLEIPALSVSAPILGVSLTDDGWDLTWLNDQVGYLEGTAFLTRSGNTGLTVHVYDANGMPGFFVNLHTLKWGDCVILHAWEQEYIYEVREVEQVNGDDLTPLRHEEEPWITLITCRGYDEEKDDYVWRIAVHAVLVEIHGE